MWRKQRWAERLNTVVFRSQYLRKYIPLFYEIGEANKNSRAYLLFILFNGWVFKSLVETGAAGRSSCLVTFLSFGSVHLLEFCTRQCGSEDLRNLSTAKSLFDALLRGNWFLIRFFFRGVFLRKIPLNFRCVYLHHWDNYGFMHDFFAHKLDFGSARGGGMGSNLNYTSLC